MNTLAGLTMKYARAEIGQRETSRNWSPRIAEYLASVGWDKPASWCAAYACWCIIQAAKEISVPVPIVTGLSTIKLWNRNSGRRVTPGPGVDLAGCLALRNDGAGSGHTMIVEAINPGGTLHTISGNTFPGGNSPMREGVCVAEHDIPLAQFEHGYGFVRIG